MLSYLDEYNSKKVPVEDVVHDFMNVKVEDLNWSLKTDAIFEGMIMEIQRGENVFKDLLDEMDYMEFITFLDMSRDEKYLRVYDDGSPCTPEMLNCFIYKYMIVLLINAREHCGAVRRFFELPLDEYIQYMKEMMQVNEKELVAYSEWVYDGVMGDLDRLHNDAIKENASVKDLLLDIKQVVFREWGILDNSIMEYFQLITDEISIFRTLFVEFFMLAYPERIDEEKIFDRYTSKGIFEIMNYEDKLKRICNDKGYKKYGFEYFEKMKPIVDMELEYIYKIPNGARDFVIMSEFIEKVRKYYGRTCGKAMFGFRGGINSSLVAYLCGITDCEPKGDYSWTYLHSAKKIIFDINLPFNLYEKIYSYYGVKIPSCAALFSCLDLSIFEGMDAPAVDYSDEEFSGIFDKFWEKPERFGYIYYWRKKHVPESGEIFDYLIKEGKLPKDKEQLVKLVGFLFSEFEDEKISHFDLIKSYGDNLYEEMVSTQEDVYDVLMKNGVDKDNAINIASRVGRRIDKLYSDEMIYVMEHCGEEYMSKIRNIKSLFCRAQCTEISNHILHMMNLMEKDFEKYSTLHNQITGEE